jgi:hypothetical protein
MLSLPSRPPASFYIAGLFAMGYTDFHVFPIPLYGLSLGMNASEIGMLVNGRSLLAVFLSSHVGGFHAHCAVSDPPQIVRSRLEARTGF